jgi:1-acyl-sn-glycerol-3-phosphate acyltransferase
MYRARAFAFEAFMWTSVVGYGSLLLVLSPFVSRQRLTRIGRAWQHAILRALKRLCRIEHRVHGMQQLGDGRGRVIMSNHQSAWETIALGTIFPVPQTWVMKRELLRIPFFGWALALFEPIAIERRAGRRAMRQLLEQGADRLARGHCVVIFPEGTRVDPGAAGRFSLGGALLAVRGGAPVIPVAHNAGTLWPRRRAPRRAGIIDVIVGPPIETVGRSAEAVNAEVKQWITTAMRSLPGNRPAAAPSGTDSDGQAGRRV